MKGAKRAGWSPHISQSTMFKPFQLPVCWAWFRQIHVIKKWKKVERLKKAKGGMTYFQFILTVRRKKLTSIFFNTSSVLVSEVSLPVSFVFLKFGPAEVKPLITHYSVTATVYCISLPFNMLSRIVICHTRQSHHLQTELIFLKNEQNKSAHLNNFPWEVNDNHLMRYFFWECKQISLYKYWKSVLATNVIQAKIVTSSGITIGPVKSSHKWLCTLASYLLDSVLHFN